jgi:hypothetical protein
MMVRMLVLILPAVSVTVRRTVYVVTGRLA